MPFAPKKPDKEQMRIVSVHRFSDDQIIVTFSDDSVTVYTMEQFRNVFPNPDTPTQSNRKIDPL